MSSLTPLRYAHRVGALRLTGARDFLVLVDLRAEGEAARYWVIPAQAAGKLVHNEEIRTKEIGGHEGRWAFLEAT